MSNEVTIGKQDGEVKTESRPVALQDIPPRVRKQLVAKEKAEVAPSIAAAASSPIEEQLEWFRAYRYGLYDVVKNEDEAFDHLDQYVALRENSGEERFNVYRELLHSFAQGNEHIQADIGGSEHIAKKLYVSVDVQDKDSISSALAILNSENVHNDFTDYLQRMQEQTENIKHLFHCQPAEKPPYWKYLIGFYPLFCIFKKDKKLFFQFIAAEAFFVILSIVYPTKFSLYMIFALVLFVQSFFVLKEIWQWTIWKHDCILWEVLHKFKVIHPQLETLNDHFANISSDTMQADGLIKLYIIITYAGMSLLGLGIVLFG